MRAPLATTVLQVGSRFMLVWGIVNTFPSATGSSPAYTTMLLAWSITEIIRYSYFVANLVMGSSEVPEFLTWLRYNTFFVLYPVGILSECWLVWLAVAPARREYGEPAGWLLGGVLGVYVPGKYCSRFEENRRGFSEVADADSCNRKLYAVHAYDGAEAEGYAGIG